MKYLKSKKGKYVTIPVKEYKRLTSLDNDSNRLELDDEVDILSPLKG